MISSASCRELEPMISRVHAYVHILLICLLYFFAYRQYAFNFNHGSQI